MILRFEASMLRDGSTSSLRLNVHLPIQLASCLLMALIM